jgi:hypothetical protein
VKVAIQSGAPEVPRIPPHYKACETVDTGGADRLVDRLIQRWGTPQLSGLSTIAPKQCTQRPEPATAPGPNRRSSSRASVWLVQLETKQLLLPASLVSTLLVLERVSRAMCSGLRDYR